MSSLHSALPYEIRQTDLPTAEWDTRKHVLRHVLRHWQHNPKSRLGRPKFQCTCLRSHCCPISTIPDPGPDRDHPADQGCRNPRVRPVPRNPASQLSGSRPTASSRTRRFPSPRPWWGVLTVLWTLAFKNYRKVSLHKWSGWGRRFRSASSRPRPFRAGQAAQATLRESAVSCRERGRATKATKMPQQVPRAVGRSFPFSP